MRGPRRVRRRNLIAMRPVAWLAVTVAVIAVIAAAAVLAIDSVSTGVALAAVAVASWAHGVATAIEKPKP